MKIVIDIPKEDYKRMMEQSMFGKADVWRKSIQNGTPLPKGHGRLIDAEELEKNLILNDWITNDDGGGLEDILHNSPTIIEADEAESEE